MIDVLINSSKDEVINFLRSTFSIDAVANTELENCILQYTKSIISLKLWHQKLNSINANEYFKEIISNYNQSLILSSIGLYVPSTILLRRSLENILAFIYYKDHNIEFIKKEFDESKRSFDKIDDLTNYLKEFPFKLYYPAINEAELKSLLEESTGEWKKNYKYLSHYVHSSNTSFLNLRLFLENITFDSTQVEKNLSYQAFTISFINTILILFFFNDYNILEQHEKTLIRSLIDTNSTQRLMRIFTDF